MTRRTGASANRSANRSIAASVAKTRSTEPDRSAASTRLGPSARKRPARRRAAGRCSLTASITVCDRSVSAVESAGMLRRLPRPER
ncbi:Uncharacterised protein [Mycobacteroides abscessus subsp. abscessus]|nr:Uncharacterised protein [Mycobacteroides abscessus subsp. abscessus]